MAHTTFSKYTLVELLHLVDNKRASSPIIDELCTRLEAGVHEDANHEVTCSVGEATLEVKHDAENLCFTLQIEN